MVNTTDIKRVAISDLIKKGEKAYKTALELLTTSADVVQLDFSKTVYKAVLDENDNPQVEKEIQKETVSTSASELDAVSIAVFGVNRKDILKQVQTLEAENKKHETYLINKVKSLIKSAYNPFN